jgi:hypothetical protein
MADIGPSARCVRNGVRHGALSAARAPRFRSTSCAWRVGFEHSRTVLEPKPGIAACAVSTVLASAVRRSSLAPAAPGEALEMSTGLTDGDQETLPFHVVVFVPLG